MKRFKSPRQVQRFLFIHDLIANLFHFPPHRLSASGYRAGTVKLAGERRRSAMRGP